MSNVVSCRQLRTARIFPRLSQAEFAKAVGPHLISDDGRSTPDAILIPSMSDEITMRERWLADLTEDAGGYSPGVGCETRDR
jgi:hypothetical protein